MKTALILVTIVSTLSSASAAKSQILSENFIKSINQKQSTWLAGRNFAEDTPLEYLRGLNGLVEDPRERASMKLERHDFALDIPEIFDAREQWPHCQSIGSVRDQGRCGSCWAFAVAEFMTDRLCIDTEGQLLFQFSPEDLLSCCTSCGSGCDGGNRNKALKYWIESGIVSGGDYQSDQGCQPYMSEAFLNGSTPQCQLSCINANYEEAYAPDKHYGSDSYYIEKDVEQIQKEIITKGPVSAGFKVYDDFYNYKSGVYQFVSGEYRGSHAIKIIGWGVEEGTPYWLIANSWGGQWGLDGFFKIARGVDEVGIESNVYAGIPKLPGIGLA